jgi:hypothetical protein
MRTNYNRSRYYAPSMSTRLNDVHEALGRTQKELAEVKADRDRWRDLCLEVIAKISETENEQ